MNDKSLSDIEISDNPGDTSIAGRDITSTVVGDTTVGDIFNTITSINIPSDNTDDKLQDSLTNNRELLKKSKRTLALLVLNDARGSKEMKTAIRNIKMSGDNISSLINVLSVRGVACEHLPNEDNYEYEVIEILHLKNTMKHHHVQHSCPHCGERLKVKMSIPKHEMVAAISKPDKALYILEKCSEHRKLNNLEINRSSSEYCKYCKNKICIYFSVVESSILDYINKNYPE